jgi:hypothetical protein
MVGAERDTLARMGAVTNLLVVGTALIETRVSEAGLRNVGPGTGPEPSQIPVSGSPIYLAEAEP